MRISERERSVKAPVRRCGRSALSVSGEGESCVVRTADPRYRVHECRIRCGIQVVPRYYYRPEADSLQGVYIFVILQKTGENKMKELPKVYDPKSVEKKI